MNRSSAHQRESHRGSGGGWGADKWAESHGLSLLGPHRRSETCPQPQHSARSRKQVSRRCVPPRSSGTRLKCFCEFRGGYTLLELLIASLLLATLMAATWNLMSMYSGFLVAGRQQAAEQQLSRSLLDLLASDLGSVVPPHGSTQKAAFDIVGRVLSQTGELNDSFGMTPPDEPPGLPVRDPSGVSDPADDLTPFEGFRSFGSFESAAPLPEEFFRGDEHSLTLIVSRSQPDLRSFDPGDGEMSFAAGSAISPGGDPFAAPLSPGDSQAARLGGNRALPYVRAKDWTQVIYRFEPPRVVQEDEHTLPPGLHRFEIPVEALGLLSQMEGLGGMDLSGGAGGFGDEFSFGTGAFGDDSSTDLLQRIMLLQQQGVTGIRHEHIPEVVACRFEFLTEYGWRPWWEPMFERERPAAVRVKFKLLSSQERGELMTLLGSTDTDEASEEVGERPVDAVPAVVPTGSGTANPFDAFEPRTYERIVLLELPRDVRTNEGQQTPGSDDPFLDRPYNDSRDGSPASGLLTGGAR